MQRIVVTERFYIQPLDLDWQVFEYRNVRNRTTGEVTEKWVNCGRYFRSFSSAVKFIYDEEIRRNADEQDIKGTKRIIEMLEELEQKIDKFERQMKGKLNELARSK